MYSGGGERPKKPEREWWKTAANETPEFLRCLSKSYPHIFVVQLLPTKASSK